MKIAGRKVIDQLDIDVLMVSITIVVILICQFGS
jgi:hypothetical protein